MTGGLTPESAADLRAMIAQARAIELGRFPPTPPTTLIIAQAKTISYLAGLLEEMQKPITFAVPGKGGLEP